MEVMQFPTKEIVDISLALTAFGLLHFTTAQRKWIKERDDYQCQCPECTGHGGSLYVHHIVPDTLARYEGFEADSPLNGITLCQSHHDKIHKVGNKAFETERGMVVWGAFWLQELAGRAFENSRLAFAQGKKFPQKKASI